jgi:hypothetical protein
MPVSINRGENFYCQTFSGVYVPDSIADGVEIASKVWAARGLPVVPGDHWEKWLGELASRDIRTGLVLTTTTPQPERGHVVNLELKRRLNHLAYGLIFQGVPDYRESFLIGGANEMVSPKLVSLAVHGFSILHETRGTADR